MVLFKWWLKGRYIFHSMSDSKYKSEEITGIYVHIIASRLQLIYIWCGVLLIILGINFVSFFETVYQRMYDF